MFSSPAYRCLPCLLMLMFCLAGVVHGQGAARADRTRFVVVGHTYPIVKDSARMQELLAAIRAEKPDYVCLLGDSGLESEATVAMYKEALPHKLLFAPGNHEMRGPGRAAYQKNIGYLQTVETAPQCHFVVINSCDSAENIAAFLKSSLPELSKDRPVVLLAHHRIWDDTLIDAKSYSHDKSYPFAELYPLLEGRVKYVFAGNSRRQYFRDLATGPSKGKQNLHNVFWCDRVGSITCYSCGMGDGKPKATFVVVDMVEGNITVSPRHVPRVEKDPTYAAEVSPDPKKSVKSIEKDARRAVRRSFWWGLGSGFVLGAVGVRMLLRARREGA